ncbi:MAG: hypothetical protein ACYC65_03820 [Candidatus Limnocylindrales bacterium]
MRTPARPLGLWLFAALLLAGCGGAGSGSSQSPSTLDSPEAAAAAVQARSPLFDGFEPVNQDVIGQDRWWEAEPLDTATPPAGWAITFTAGWGDCQAGCIDRHSWTWDVAADGTVTFVSEEGSPLNDGLIAGLIRDAKGPGAGGRVNAGPTCPVERPDDPTCTPRMVAGAVLLVRDGADKEIARLTTDGSGLFRLGLEAGDYTLEPQPVEGLMGTAAPMPFTVGDGGLTWLDVGYDTGIR